jgi:DNA helicase II / ATP-dependent DNA helicase PcrA
MSESFPSYLDTLNPQQRVAAVTVDGPVLIIAGAGTGKTKTITYRMHHLMQSGTPGWRILGITFTNKAAREMRERVTHLAGFGAESVPLLCTFHSLGVRILREFGEHLGLKKGFSILDTDDTVSMVRGIMKQQDVDTKTLEPKRVRDLISKWKNDGLTVDEAGATARNARDEVVTRIWRTYEEQKTYEGALDFDDLLLSTLKLLQTVEEVREKLQSRWQYVHIDEYQDTNRVQYDLARLLSAKHGNLCVVGDIDQSIYSWRGARVRTMLEFERDFPGTTVVSLEQNYRSTKTIIAAAEAVIKKNTARLDKTLFTENKDGELVDLLAALSEYDEARHVASETQKLVEAGVAPADIAVLYRMNFQSRTIEEILLAKSIPYHVTGTRFFDRAEVKDLLAYLSLAYDPENLTAIKRAIVSPRRGLGPAALELIISGRSEQLPPKQKQTYTDFANVIDILHTFASENELAETVRKALDLSGLYEQLQQGPAEDKERAKNLEELVSLAVHYPGSGLDVLRAFLDDAALYAGKDELADAAGGVSLMTVHAAKGLEFPYVFIIGMEQGIFPSERMGAASSVEDREEERRLFYVALTRAKEKLFLSYALSRTLFGSTTFQAPSSFLADVPTELTQSIGNSAGISGISTVYLD